MTRLTAADVLTITDNWKAYDHCQRQVLGVDLPTLAARAVGRDPARVKAALAGRKLAAVSITEGGGIIGGFAESLAAIGRRLGLTAEAMTRANQEGLKEAELWGADLVIYATDDRFLALNLHSGQVADNNPATSRVFVAALELMAEDQTLAGREVVVLGLGIIGRGAAGRLVELGARPLMYDPAPGPRETAARVVGEGGEVLPDNDSLARALKRTNLIFEAVCCQRALPPEFWPLNPVVAAPGVPLSWPLEWLRGHGGGRLWHDQLQSGTAAMLAELA